MTEIQEDGDVVEGEPGMFGCLDIQMSDADYTG